MYGDGAQGIEKLVQAMEEARKKEKGYDAKKDPGMDEDLAGLMARIKDGKDLTMGDLDMMQGKTFDFLQKMQGIKPRQPGDPVLKGLDGKQITSFIAQSPALKKMFEEKEMGLDSIDLSGDGRGEHIVLGIGRDNMGPKGTRSMIYDPYARQDKRNSGQYMKYDDVEAIRRDERAKMQNEYTEIWDSDMSTEQKLAAAEKLDEKVQEQTHARQYAYKPASQLVTSHAELGDYARATDYQGTGTGTRDLKAQTEAERPFLGMYH
jgi:hypothetical protein